VSSSPNLTGLTPPDTHRGVKLKHFEYRVYAHLTLTGLEQRKWAAASLRIMGHHLADGIPVEDGRTALHLDVPKRHDRTNAGRHAALIGLR
jgi:hypothetical protein